MPGRFLTRDQVAEELGVSPWVVYSLIRKGRLPAIRIGARGVVAGQPRGPRGIPVRRAG
jgi:excisionase family DNA binding protein